MSLITITGLPCSGKSTRAALLKVFLEDHGKRVTLVNDLDIYDRSCFDDLKVEKQQRARLLNNITRAAAAAGPDDVVVIDGLNYIKGLRYQIYCIAREFNLKSCVVWCIASNEQCDAWNQRDELWTRTGLSALQMRYEEPNGSDRWDSPLITLLPSDPIPIDFIYTLNGSQKPTVAATKPIQARPRDHLQTLEATTKGVTQALVGALVGCMPGSILMFTYNETDYKLPLSSRHSLPTPAQLQRLRRDYSKMNKHESVLEETGIVDSFLKFIADSIAS